MMRPINFIKADRLLVTLRLKEKLQLMALLPLLFMIGLGAYTISLQPDNSLVVSGLIVAGVLLCSLLTYYVISFVNSALIRSYDVIRKVADGDLTARLNFQPGRDEFSKLAGSIDQVAESRQRIITLVKESSEALEELAGELSAHASGSVTLSIEQREKLDALATAIEQMSAAVREVAQNAEQTSEQTQLASNETAQGQQRVVNAVSAIETLTKEIGEASRAVNQLAENAGKIDAVVTTINAISGQTNLLALNAAIEAARAGEQGRGFAVVADEVRTLAKRTQNATVEIQSMIEALQSGTQTLGEVMHKTVEQANQGLDLVTEVGRDFNRINDYNRSIFGMAAQIATSVEEQSAVAEEIAQHIHEVRSRSMELEQASTEAHAGIQGLDATAEELKCSLA